MSINISVVIGTFQLKDKLKLVLDSFAAQTYPVDQFEVVVVDSESTDGTADMLKAYRAPYALRYFIQPNSGKSAARNRGVNEALGELVIITDADMVASPPFIKAHKDMHSRFDPPILVQGKTWILSKELLPTELVRRRPYISHKVTDGQKLDFYYCLTGNLSLPRKVLLDVGGLDETFTGYGWEDIDLGVRLIKGLKLPLRYAQDAVNDHFHVWTEVQEWQRRYKMGQSVGAVIEKHPSLRHFLGVHALNKLLYMTVLFVPKWRKLANSALSDDNISRFKRWLFREYYFQLGIISSKRGK